MGISEIGFSFDVKGSAVNRGRSRVWLERKELVDYGFSRGQLIDVEFNASSIVVRLNPEGRRKVAGKADRPILDLCSPLVDHAARFGGADRLAVSVSYGFIIITAKES